MSEVLQVKVGSLPIFCCINPRKRKVSLFVYLCVLFSSLLASSRKTPCMLTVKYKLKGWEQAT